MRRPLCRRHPGVDDYAVACSACDLQSLVWAGDIIEAIEDWNEMVGPGE